ncbi:SUMF1/EgtB/PvdO family nonheme iron enzyme [Ideonella sp. 4Y16]|uniref:SUMF1/EgtB/PvdO family nonheme iron enzyme n=1 Tax=Ideonella alba TaxID=2824118 RepID=UPI001B391E7D|nr:SUMF1/EgtB/PvdO family nonheme iron enzyme [Ideonella alba]MBQ0942280.1 SUMF1/EgtB/PvdO family nonheme iron enzyme [Ideonella alba]
MPAREELQQTLDEPLGDWSREAWVAHLVGRYGAARPYWLSLCCRTPEPADPGRLKRLPSEVPRLSLLYQSLAPLDPLHEPPEHLAREAAVAILAGRTRPAHADTLSLPTSPTAPDRLVAQCRMTWLHQAAAAHDELSEAERWLAADMLGQLSDTLRFRALPLQGAQQGPGLQPALWRPIGRPGVARLAVRIGSCWRGFADERPAWRHDLAPLAAAACLVTVAEWRWFTEQAKGYADPQALWWQAAGPDAQRWLASRPNDRPPGLDDPRFSQPLQPMVGLNQYEALAHAAWLKKLLPGDGSEATDVRLPTELEWEAAVRGPQLVWFGPQRHWPHASGWRRLWPQWRPAPNDFNHDATRCNRPTPVGLFPQSGSPTGLLDASGIVWEGCSSELISELLAHGVGTPGSRETCRRTTRWRVSAVPSLARRRLQPQFTPLPRRMSRPTASRTQRHRSSDGAQCATPFRTLDPGIEGSAPMVEPGIGVGGPAFGAPVAPMAWSPTVRMRD